MTLNILVFVWSQERGQGLTTEGHKKIFEMIEMFEISIMVLMIGIHTFVKTHQTVYLKKVILSVLGCHS